MDTAVDTSAWIPPPTSIDTGYFPVTQHKTKSRLVAIAKRKPGSGPGVVRSGAGSSATGGCDYPTKFSSTASVSLRSNISFLAMKRNTALASSRLLGLMVLRQWLSR